MDASKTKVKFNRRLKNKGETLVEIVVTFVLVFIVMNVVTLVVKSSTSINIKAAEKAESIETASTAIEKGYHMGNKEDGVLTISLPSQDVNVTITVEEEEPLTYFYKK